ncbi:Retrovirus-related Pol polyprotein from transposon TNT 1-94 [Cucumis melo var. makuwa]|uniref:Retrovirus-related Pol polyprotein from transposon TNT 1-94 n=1 Tax=Cucumis melo var. makuwa TaxID=1194695 RepID=A0A5D3DSI9_CUCMM|nr:Retrovirus-related Pol polyprotein from transposon TNT 1-94 [Cucumis melo var. makuwa]
MPLEIPNTICTDISMNFIEGLPRAVVWEVIMVVVDHMSKYTHFIALKHPYTGKTVVEVFVKEVECLHEELNLPSIIGGQTEVVNREVAAYLSYGRLPPPLIHYGGTETPNSTLDQQLKEGDIALKAWKEHLQAAQNKMKKYADMKRRAIGFQTGDMVFLKIRPYRQSSLRKKRNEKLSPKRSLRKEVGSPANQPASVQNFEPLRDLGNIDTEVILNGKNSNDENEVSARVTENERNDRSKNISKHDLSLDLPIALRKGTRAFTASLDSIVIPKYIHIALECSKWKNVVMKEMRVLEKNQTWEIHALPKDIKLWDTNGCSLSNKRQMEPLTDTRQGSLQKGLLQLMLVVKNVFLNGDLEEEVYMSPPRVEAQFGHQVSKTGNVAVLIVYVDDIVPSGDDHAEIIQLKERMGDEFEIKDLGNLKYFLGMEVARSKEGIFVSQRKYALNLMTETVPVDKEQYQYLVDKLIYLSHTRLDISFIVSVVSQFVQAPYEEHMEGKSTSDYYTFVWGNLVTWRSKKQGVMARSNAKAKYRAMSLGT